MNAETQLGHERLYGTHMEGEDVVCRPLSSNQTTATVLARVPTPDIPARTRNR
jgi:hypothetical protein